MDSAAALLFMGVFALAVASPGPAVVAVVSHALSRGASGLYALILGLALGDLFWLTLTALGLSALAQHYQLAFTILRYLGALYLFYLAYKLWTAPAEVEISAEEGSRTHGASLSLGLSINLGNPKAAAFYLALLPSIVNLAQLSILGYMELAAMIVLILSSVLALYAVLALRARRLLRSERAVRVVNRLSSSALGLAAIAVAARGS
jgi:threonine/homoserine/homoserine lactone efflux protein